MYIVEINVSGLQFTLSQKNQETMVDTIVMANLGYFQLKANPGVWQLALREGRSADIYDVASHEGTDSGVASKPQILVASFNSQVAKIRVAKKQDKQHLDLLEEETETGGIWNTIANTFSSQDDEKEEEVVNIFSVASGHLYDI